MSTLAWGPQRSSGRRPRRGRKRSSADRPWDVIVAGGGPAGLTAGFYLARAGRRVLLVERERLGGQAARIPVLYNYPGFPDGVRGRLLMGRLSRQALRWGLRTLAAEAARIERSGRGWVVACGRPRVIPRKCRLGGLVRGRRSFRAKAVVVATGSEFLPLGVPGEGLRGVAHAPFDRVRAAAGKTVAVVGGGEAAAHQALALAAHASRVFLLVRGRGLKAIAPLREGVSRHPRIRACYNSTVRRVLGSGALDGIEWTEGAGRPKPLRLDALYVLVGKRPRLPRIVGAGRGLFVAGDAREGAARQVAVAAADGISKAMECEAFLNDQPGI